MIKISDDIVVKYRSEIVELREERMEKMIPVVKVKRNQLMPVHCLHCGGWMLDMEMSWGLITMKCPCCKRRLIIRVESRIPIMLAPT